MSKLTKPRGFLAVGYKKADKDFEGYQLPKKGRFKEKRYVNLLTEKNICEKIYTAGFHDILIKLEIPSNNKKYNYGYVIAQKNS